MHKIIADCTTHHAARASNDNRRVNGGPYDRDEKPELYYTYHIMHQKARLACAVCLYHNDPNPTTKVNLAESRLAVAAAEVNVAAWRINGARWWRAYSPALQIPLKLAESRVPRLRKSYEEARRRWRL